MAGIEDLSLEVLRHHYEVEGLTDTEIAAKFGTGQARVSRLRARLGIPTRLKSDRLNLPPFTAEQESLLLGSILGDGSLAPIGKATARFSESHGAAQEDYLRWKASLLEPFVSTIIPTVKREDDGREHHGWRLQSKSCRHLRPLLDRFYPDGAKRFPRDLALDPLSLAVWYMDDGDLAGFHPRITFGLDERSLAHALTALRRIGFKPELHTADKIVSITFPGQADRFFDLVRPHVPPAMHRKLSAHSERRDADRRARALEPGRALELREGGMAVEDIARTYGVGVTTVRRRLSSVGAPRKPMGRPRRAYTRVAADAALSNYDATLWPTLSEDEQARWVGEVFAILRKTEFPREPEPSREEVLAKLDQVRRAPMRLEDGRIVPRSNAGTVMCKGLFPNRYRATSKGKASALEAWHDDARLRAAIRFQLQHGDPVLPKRVLWAVCLEQRTPSVFRPTVARFVYETFCPPGGTVWDPCAGYGGRLLGAAAAGVRYIGTDVEPETVAGNRALADLIGPEWPLGAEIHQVPAESFEPPPVDLVFTSPPYFDRERYSDAAAQSWRSHGGGFDGWVAGFLRPVLVKARAALEASRGRLVLNVADTRERGIVLPLVARAVEEAQAAGFDQEAVLTMPIASVNRHVRGEPVLVFLAR